MHAASFYYRRGGAQTKALWAKILGAIAVVAIIGASVGVPVGIILSSTTTANPESKSINFLLPFALVFFSL